MSSKHSHRSDEIIEDVEKVSSPSLDLSPKAERKLLRKIDWRMLPLLGLIYSVSLIDRTNLGIARTAGMAKDLKLTVGNRFSIASLVYFIPYILLQLPSNLFLRKFGVRNALTFYVTSWGLAQLGMGFVKHWGLLCLCRVLLGVFEAGFFPALVFVITTWYTRQEVQKRLAAFYLTSIFISGFSSIFAYVLNLLHGAHGYAGWQWIFIIEGVITTGLGLLTYFFICDFPDRNRFLTPQETSAVIRRVQDDRGDAIPDEITRQKVFKHLGDWTIWAYGLMFMCSTMPAYAIGYFGVIIIGSMGYTTSQTLLLGAPPYACAALSCWIFAYYSDKHRSRAPFLAAQACITITGLLMMAYAPKNSARYAGIFFANSGASGCVPGVLAYNANNVLSHSKRAVSTAIVVSFGGIGGILATTVFREQDFPFYRNGLWATFGAQILLLLLLVCTTITYARRNKQTKTSGGAFEGQPGFLYTL